MYELLLIGLGVVLGAGAMVAIAFIWFLRQPLFR